VHRILVITPEYPYPPEQGASLRNFYILLGLSGRYDVTLLSATKDEKLCLDVDDSPLTEACRTIRIVHVPDRSPVKRVSRLVTSRSPDMAHRFQDSTFEKTLIEVLSDNSGGLVDKSHFNIAQIEGIELAQAMPIIRRCSPETRIVYDAHNAETDLQRSAFHTDLASVRRWPGAAYSYVQTRRLDRYEAWACQTADEVIAVSDSDADCLSRYRQGQAPTVIPNCIDLRDYESLPSSSNESFDLLFTGKMDYRPNVDAVLWFADEIWPRILEKRPETSWAIVGQKPHSRLEGLRTSPGITITGYVDRVQPYLAGTKVVVLPLRMGSGTRLKLLEALASSKPVVSTTLGAEGYPGVGETGVMIADDPEHYASSVLSLLDDRTKRQELGTAGSRYALNYDWRRVIPMFDGVYNALLMKGSSQAN
jgi:glycosyltransferase involved in cell wall biosynthesis